MEPLKIVSYVGRKGVEAGVAIGDRLYPAIDLPGRYPTVQSMLDDWPRALSNAYALAADPTGRSSALGDVALAAPLPRPPAIYCAGANYRDHAANMARVQNLPPEPDPRELGLGPFHFMKSGSVVIGPEQTMESRSDRLDWEAELAVIVGRAGKDIRPEEALSYVAGYTAANDLSARDHFRRPSVNDLSPFKYDWIAHKNFDGACPMGPWIIPAGEILDPQNLSIELWVNDVVKQSSRTSEMIFTVAEQISHLSKKLTLHPGDVILTGTPAGTGTEHGERLVPGDIVRVEIEKVGSLTTRIAEASRTAVSPR